MRKLDEILVALCLVITLSLWGWLVDIYVGFRENPLFAGLVNTLFIVYAFQPLRSSFRKLILRIIAPVYFERNRRLREYLSELSQVEHYQEILESVPSTLKEIYEADIVALFVRRKGIFKVEASQAPAPFVLEGLALDQSHDLLERLRKSADYLLPVRYSIVDLSPSDDKIDEMNYRTFKVFNWAIPLKSNDVLAGFVLLDKLPRDMEARRAGTLFNNAIEQISLILDNKKLYHRIRLESLKQGILTQIAEKMSATRSISGVFNAILDDVHTVLPYDACGVFLTTPNAITIEKFLQRGYDPRRLNPLKLKIGRGIVGRCIATNSAVSIRDVTREKRYVAGRQKTRSELCVPIASGNRVFGAINIESNQIAAFSDDDQDFLLTVATQAGVLMERYDILKKIDLSDDFTDDIDKAESIQRSLLPQETPVASGIEFDISYMPCKQISGDFYDLTKRKKDIYSLAVGDVVGKGISGALIMSNFYAAYLNELGRDRDLTEIMARLNEYLTRDPDLEQQITFFLSYLDMKKGVLRFVNAGHPPPLLFHKDGTFDRLEIGGSILGYDPSLKFDKGEIKLKRDDFLVMYTDGLVEAVGPAGQLFDESGLIEIVRTVLTKPAGEMAETIIDRIHAFSRKDSFDDDLTLLITRINKKL